MYSVQVHLFRHLKQHLNHRKSTGNTVIIDIEKSENFPACGAACVQGWGGLNHPCIKDDIIITTRWYI